MERIWVEITIETTPAAGEMVGEVLNEVGCGGVLYHDPRLYERGSDATGEIFPEDLPEQDQSFRVMGYLPLRDGLDEKINKIQTRLAEIKEYLPLGKGELTLHRIKEEDWATAWRAYYHPETVGRITITPSWLPFQAKPGEIIIKLDPGMAFGTGSHPSTKLSLALLQEVACEGAAVYDVGTGSGVLAIAAAKLGARVVAIDIDPVAVEIARENIDRNQVSAQVQAYSGNLLGGVQEQADLIITNIIAEVIINLIPEAAEKLKPDGCLIVSGIIKDKAEKVSASLGEAGFTIIKTLDQEEWLAYLAQKSGD